ncbi:MAG: hypothetical protein EZS28_014062 [Streblomastix strix]|uniref:Uncharacterized protein n=1 Tax=Streblomastix strix TaxID=222440 RepID=A0A5J4W6K9_9EUKA|nr:MAG: hypothetical protein EZS28_014062 [Streblomastix strix]
MFLNPLVILLLYGNSEASYTSQFQLISLVKTSKNLLDILLKCGFIESARYVLNDELTPNHSLSNLLDVIQGLILFGLNVTDLNCIVPALAKLSESKSSEKYRTVQKAKSLHQMLLSKGVSGPSVSSSKDSDKLNSAHLREIEDLKRKITDLEHQIVNLKANSNSNTNSFGQSKQGNAGDLEKQNNECKLQIEEQKKNIASLEQKNKEKSKKNFELEARVEESKKREEQNKAKISDLEKQLAIFKLKVGLNQIPKIKGNQEWLAQTK